MTKKVAIISIKSLLIFAALYFMLVHVKLPFAEVLYFLTHTNTNFYVSVLLFTAFLMLQAWIWVQILNDSGKAMPWFKGMMIYINSQFAKYIPGGFWNYLGRIYYTSREGIPLQTQLVTLLYENILLVMAASVYAVILAKLTGMIGFAWLAVFVVGLALFFFYYQPVTGILEKGVHRFIKKFRHVPMTLTRRSFFTYLFYFLVSHMVMGWAFWLLLVSMGVHNIGFFYAAGTFAAAWLIGLMSPLPGGLGVREGIIVFLIGLVVKDAALATQISIIARIWNVISEVLFFLIVNGAYHLRRRWGHQ
ncbi:UPF0104 family protein [Xylanibacillus composti]|uniref:Phosphatidylglycerol lysyltransferase n=1 Tax=Xylanibacillus composti TaxID=1572762 RepID=A0A8J4H1Y2_9BACL|nr:lysylphosphatidylglycerol synthase transmembrane domain-containing protein [Xylanibacillus composti]MDT9725790.1 UPF0104 family protein [Xylanibacillus composti]GIQ67494.1 hypothetical protein XYCOK13_03180 [Xylanibacillus composti]